MGRWRPLGQHGLPGPPGEDVAVILSQYGCEQVTLVAGIVHHVLEEASLTDGRAWAEDRRQVRARGPRDRPGCPRAQVRPAGSSVPGNHARPEYLTQLAIAEPRALDICVADELHACGSIITALERLGPEYLQTVSRAGSAQTIWWYRSMLEVLETRPDWPRRDMLEELRMLSADLVRSLRRREQL